MTKNFNYIQFFSTKVATNVKRDIVNEYITDAYVWLYEMLVKSILLLDSLKK